MVGGVGWAMHVVVAAIVIAIVILIVVVIVIVISIATAAAIVTIGSSTHMPYTSLTAKIRAL